MRVYALALLALVASVGAVPVVENDAEISNAEIHDVLGGLVLHSELVDENLIEPQSRYGRALIRIRNTIEYGGKKAEQEGFEVPVAYSPGDNSGDSDFVADLAELVEAEAEYEGLYGFGKRLRAGLKKVGKSLERAGKKIIEKGITIPITIPLAAGYGQSEESSLYGFRKSIKKIGKGIERAGKKIIGGGVEVSVSGQTGYSLENASEEETDVNSADHEVYGLGKRFRKGLKKIGKGIEKVGKKIIEGGVEISASGYSLGDDERINSEIDTSSDQTYGFGKRFRKGLKKIGKGIEKVGKKIIEGGVEISASGYSLENKEETVNEIESTNDELYGFGKRFRKGLKKIGKGIEKVGKKIIEGGIEISASGYSLGDGEGTNTEIDSTNDELYGFGKRFRKGLKKIGKGIEKVGKKIIEGGVEVSVSGYSLGEEEGKTAYIVNEEYGLLGIRSRLRERIARIRQIINRGIVITIRPGV